MEFRPFLKKIIPNLTKMQIFIMISTYFSGLLLTIFKPFFIVLNRFFILTILTSLTILWNETLSSITFLKASGPPEGVNYLIDFFSAYLFDLPLPSVEQIDSTKKNLKDKTHSESLPIKPDDNLCLYYFTRAFILLTGFLGGLFMADFFIPETLHNTPVSGNVLSNILLFCYNVYDWFTSLFTLQFKPLILLQLYIVLKIYIALKLKY